MLSKTQAYQRLIEGGVVPIIRVESAEQALRVAEALKAGGVYSIEVTMTVPGALRVLEELAAAYGDEIALGAGTVLDAETARACILAGAEFIVSPITDDRVIEVCKRYSKIVCPGALTPTEVVHAWERGADIVKIFPCDNVGGPAYIKALKGPLPQVEMMPTGGVTVDTAGEFIKAGATVVAAGSALVKGEWVKEGNYEAITANAQRFIEAVRTARAAG